MDTHRHECNRNWALKTIFEFLKVLGYKLSIKSQN